MTYDDERVIALLKESVPEVPEAPARVDSVRRLASRQRSAAAFSVVAAAASVLLVVAGVAAFLRTADRRPVEPVRDPVPLMLEALRERKSVHVEWTHDMPIDPLFGLGNTMRKGSYRLDGSYAVERSSIRSTTSERRVVDGVVYRTRDVGEELPPGKKWVRESDRAPAEAEVVAFVRTITEATRDVRYAGAATVRGVAVAEYTAVAENLAGLEGVDPGVRLAIDADGLPRRITLTFESGDGAAGYWVDFFDYDRPVDVEAPPPSEVVDEGDVKQVPEGPDARTMLWSCTTGRRLEEAQLDACVDAYKARVEDGVSCETTWARPDDWTYVCDDGTSGRSGP